ncbi:MAG: hypothetical protein D6698_13825 [Gammaproteobacteria bacterium]|nr:MAG: hypothetical protein D6698_13825 [Gammaproteobacteria bacterium]
MAASATNNPEINFEQAPGNISFAELSAANPGLERLIPVLVSRLDSANLNNLAAVAQGFPPAPGFIPPAVDPVTGLYITPVLATFGVTDKVKMTSASTNALLGTVTVAHNFSNVKLYNPWDALELRNGPGLLEAVGIAKAPNTLIVKMTGFMVTEPDAKVGAWQGGQVKVAVIDPATGTIVKNHYFKSGKAGHLDPYETKIIDANGDGVDDLVVGYMKPKVSGPTASGWKDVITLNIKVKNLKTGVTITQYNDVKTWLTKPSQ